MFNLICKLFIPNYENTKENSVRERYGIVFSIFSIIFNSIMVVFKLFIATISNSIAIRADGLNSLSDVGSNLATMFAFKLSNKHPDSDHPYGHGRLEYLTSMLVSIIIMYVAFGSLKDSIDKIIHPSETVFSAVTIIVLAFSIILKIIISILDSKAGKKIESDTLKAASSDSMGDAVMTSSTLVCMLINKFWGLNLDAYVGTIASILIFKAGLDIFLDVLATILGKAPDKQLVKDIEKFVMSNEGVLGMHDLMMHDYGPSQKFMSFHIEVDAYEDVIKTHDMIDNIEAELLKEFNILTTIHMDPVDTKDTLVNELKVKVNKIVLDINKDYNIHDFRIVRGPTHTNVVFDVLVPAEDKISHEELKTLIDSKVKELDPSYICVIHVDHSFV